jgi:hypothetical protein
MPKNAEKIVWLRGCIVWVEQPTRENCNDCISKKSTEINGKSTEKMPNN